MERNSEYSIVFGGKCKDLSFVIPPKTIEYSEYFQHFEMLFRYIASLEATNFDKECVKSRLRNSAYISFE